MNRKMWMELKEFIQDLKKNTELEENSTFSGIIHKIDELESMNNNRERKVRHVENLIKNWF